MNSGFVLEERYVYTHRHRNTSREHHILGCLIGKTSVFKTQKCQFAFIIIAMHKFLSKCNG